MPDVVIRISLLTRINILLGVLAVSFAPLLWTWHAIHAGEMDQLSWISLVAQVALIQFLLWYAQKRCSSENLTFWQGVAVVAASIRTHWVYTDVLLAVLVLPLMLTAAAVFAFSNRPAYLFQRLVHGFYRNRMEQ